MQDFKTAAELFTKVKADMGNRTVPELLTRLAAATTRKVAAAVHEKASALHVQTPPSPQDPKVYKFPPRAVVMLVGTGTPAEIEAYKAAFQSVNDTYLKERAKFLALLRESGIR